MVLPNSICRPGHNRLQSGGHCEIPIDGGTPTRLPDSEAGWQARWSPDGTRIAYVSSSGDCDTFDSSLQIAEANGTVLQVVQEEPTPSPWYDHLLWSPSGDHVLFQWTPRTRDCAFLHADSQLRQMGVASGQVTTITAIAGVRPIRVSPDGDRILFSTHNGQSYTGLWSIDADGSNMQLLVPNAEGDWQPHQGGG